jgi:hypothetical protein
MHSLLTAHSGALSNYNIVMLNPIYNNCINHTVDDNNSEDLDYCSPTQHVTHSQSSGSPSSAKLVGFEVEEEVDYDFTNDNDTSQVCYIPTHVLNVNTFVRK